MGQNGSSLGPPLPPSTCLVSSWVPRELTEWTPGSRVGLGPARGQCGSQGRRKGQVAKRWSEPGRMVQAPGLLEGPATALGVQGAWGALSRRGGLLEGPLSLPPESKPQRAEGSEWVGRGADGLAGSGGAECLPGGAAFSGFGGRKGYPQPPVGTWGSQVSEMRMTLEGVRSTGAWPPPEALSPRSAPGAGPVLGSSPRFLGLSPRPPLSKCCRDPVPAPDSQETSEGGGGGWGAQLVPWNPGEMREKAR